MPKGNGTGPLGMGPITGRAAGFCAGYNMPGYMNNEPGHGYGIGFGRRKNFFGDGFGRRNRFFATGIPGQARFVRENAPNTDPETEKQFLKNQAEFLQTEMEAIKKRLDDLNKES